MILLVNMCRSDVPISKLEFIRPIAQIVSKCYDYCVLHRSDVTGNFIAKFDKAILCGTALKDDDYLQDGHLIEMIRGFQLPILGICAGMQAIAKSHGGEVYPWKSIGLKSMKVVREGKLLGTKRTIEGYHLHNYGVTLPDNFVTLAQDGENVMAFRSREEEVYGVLFHPEVRNIWVIDNFLEI